LLCLHLISTTSNSCLKHQFSTSITRCLSMVKLCENKCWDVTYLSHYVEQSGVTACTEAKKQATARGDSKCRQRTVAHTESSFIHSFIPATILLQLLCRSTPAQCGNDATSMSSSRAGNERTVGTTHFALSTTSAFPRPVRRLTFSSHALCRWTETIGGHLADGGQCNWTPGQRWPLNCGHLLNSWMIPTLTHEQDWLIELRFYVPRDTKWVARFSADVLLCNSESSFNKLAPYGTGGRLLLTANFKVTWHKK